MDFQDGDQVVGHYGNVWTRKSGQWWTDSKGLPSSDDTMEWLINLNVTLPKVEPKKDRKLSKSEPEPPETYIYKYTLKRILP